jgi:hypothetical protein
MSTGPRPARRPPAAGARRGAQPEPVAARRARVWLIGSGLFVAAALAGGLWWAREGRAPERPPTEVSAIAAALRRTNHAVDRVARNANGGWSVLFDDGEVQWFETSRKSDAQLHPIRVAYEARRDPNVAVVDLHDTVFAIVLSGRRQGSTLELGTAPTKAADVSAIVLRAKK